MLLSTITTLFHFQTLTIPLEHFYSAELVFHPCARHWVSFRICWYG